MEYNEEKDNIIHYNNIGNESNYQKEGKSKQRSKFEDLKSKYILIKIFNLMTKKKLLKIMHYNKKLQKIRFNH